MAGHSKWKKIKNKKQSQDRAKSKIYSRIAREISNAVKTNSNLQTALTLAKINNVPKDIIERAMNVKQKEVTDECIYEAFVDNVAIIIRAYPDNKIKTSAEIKAIFNKHGGQLSNCLYLFDSMDYLEVKESYENIFNLVGDLLIDIEENEEYCALYTKNINKVLPILEQNNYEITEKNRIYLPHSTIISENPDKINKITDLLEEIGEVDEVFHNCAT